MSILNIFKNKKKDDANNPVKTKAFSGGEHIKKNEIKTEKSGDDKKEKTMPKDALISSKSVKKQKGESSKKRITDKSGNIYSWIKESHITEKSTDLANVNKYVFRVFNHSNKQEVKKAIESFYGVDVLKINVINMPGKTRQLGRHKGYKSGFRKAVVTLKEGSKIEVMPH